MGQIFWDNYLLRTEGKPGPNIWGVKGFTEFHVVPKLKLFALSAGKCLMAGNGCRHLSSMATCSCISSHGSLLVLGFIHWDVVGHREGIFFMCRLCALHYVCVFVCWCYWLPRPALLCNAKLIWPVVFLSGKLLHFSCNPSQWRSYWELKPVPTEQCAVHMNRQHACVSLCVCVYGLSLSSASPRAIVQKHRDSAGAPCCCPLFCPFSLFFSISLPFNSPSSPFHLYLSFPLLPPLPLLTLSVTLPHPDEDVQAQFRRRLGVPQRIPSKLLFHPGIKFPAYLNTPLCLLLLLDAFLGWNAWCASNACLCLSVFFRPGVCVRDMHHVRLLWSMIV